MRKTVFAFFLSIILSSIIVACSGIDCPLNNVVYTRYALKKNIRTKSDPEIVQDVFLDTLSVWTKRADGRDSTLNINMDTKVEAFRVPISYVNDADTLVIRRYNRARANYDKKDTVIVSKTNIAHFESVDCAPNYFHEITGVKTTHNAIDSITVNNKMVTYDATDNFYIFFKD